ncbi:hypothetical protein SF23_05280 [Streptomyces sp. MBRL 10]|nr:hypothetical protein SF23_05280 [Streptomyces sp. MBRL 10]
MAMCPRLRSWTTTSIRGSDAARARATSPESSGEASSMISTRTSTPGCSSRTLRTQSARKWPYL